MTAHEQMKPGDRVRWCPHLEVLVRQGQPVPDIWIEHVPPKAWAIVCESCNDAAHQQGISANEQISRAKGVY